MKDHIQKAIENLTEKVTGSVESADAMRYTQAALNLAHLETVVSENEKRNLTPV